MANKNKRLKSALIASVIAMLLSVAMLFGTTFAWFTDSVSNTNNIIKSGNLDIELSHSNTFGFDETIGEAVKADTKLFLNTGGEQILWEPGVKADETFRIQNMGSLALKYELRVKSAFETEVNGKKLSDVLSIEAKYLEKDENGNFVTPDGKRNESVAFGNGYVIEGTLLANESVDYYVAISWNPSSIDNEYNVVGGLSMVLAIDLVATQTNFEKDGFNGSEYDLGAEFPEIEYPSNMLGKIESGDTLVLTKGEYTLPTLSDKEGVTIEGAADGSTIIGGKDTNTGFGSNFGKDTTIKNVTFAGATNGVRYSYAQGGTSTFENCTFAGDTTYGFHIDQSNRATFIFNNCTFSGFNAFAGDLEKVIFNNCTFLFNGYYGHTNIWSTAEFNNCTFGDKVSVGTRGNSAHIFFDGVEESYHHEYIGSAESLFDFAKSVNESGDSWKNQKVSLVADIDLENKAWTPIGQTGATEFKGIFDGQNHTIKNLYIDSSAQTGEHYSSGLFGWMEGRYTIKNVNVDGATVKGNHNVAVIVGYTYSGIISNCHVTNATIVDTHANDDACGDKCGLIVGYAGDESRITDCSAANSSVKAGRDAGQLIGAGYNVSVSNCSATNVTVEVLGDCTGANVRSEVIGRVLG